MCKDILQQQNTTTTKKLKKHSGEKKAGRRSKKQNEKFICGCVWIYGLYFVVNDVMT